LPQVLVRGGMIERLDGNNAAPDSSDPQESAFA
jgi:hypothetical protein